MPYISLNPASNQTIKNFPSWDSQQLQNVLEKVSQAQTEWRGTGLPQRAAVLQRASALLRKRGEELAVLITQEMGKVIREARAEVEKCAMACEYYALHGADFLQQEPVETDANWSYVEYEPLGTVLAVMPWNFPLWQVFRFAVPTLIAGNAAVLKHASNVPQCALAIEAIFRDAGFPEHLFRTLLIDAEQVAQVIASPLVHAVSLTGSEATGRKVAALAGQHLKKCVLELGGSDAFVVLRDAELEFTAQMAVASRFINCGQSCIAAKRFILVPEIADAFLELFQKKIAELKIGDPLDETVQLGPMARLDLREQLHQQVTESIALGARALVGCAVKEGNGAYYLPSVLDQVAPGQPAYAQELFGPVAVVIRAQDEADAIRIANDTPYGLGSSLWSQDVERAEILARQLQAGCTFINGIVKSDPRLPFGGIKASGFGRELFYHGLREFTNAKTVWVRATCQRNGDRRSQQSAERRGAALH
jgi:succinate-semialdehyde dehydrogenase/glutarate-semialdehyde dehydrogenase